MPTRLFLDTEFTGLYQSAQLISIALVSERGPAFYAEFIDFDPNQLSAWHQQHVLPNLMLDTSDPVPFLRDTQTIRGDAATVQFALTNWLAGCGSVEVWADVLAWDWILFCELFGGSLGLPANVFYIPFDLGTLFYLTGNPDCSREKFAFIDAEAQHLAEAAWGRADSPKHNALWDAQVSRRCFARLKGLISGL